MLCRYFLGRHEVPFEDHVEDVRELAEGYSDLELIDLDGNITGHLFHAVQNVGEPSWLKLAESLTGANLQTNRTGAAHRGLFVIGIHGHTFFMSFGHAHAVARKCRVERRFGRTIVANAKGENQLRGFTSQIYAGRGKSRTERRGHSGHNRELEIPRRLSNLQTIAARIDEDEPIIVDGGVGIQYHAPLDIESLRERTQRLLEWWSDGGVKDPWLASFDRFEVERHPETVAQLDDSLDEIILNGDPGLLSCSFDNDLIWQAEQLYCGVNRKLDCEIPEWDAEGFVMALRFAAKNGQDIRKAPLYAKLPGIPNQRIDFVRDVLCCELNVVPGRVHIFEDGAWYSVSESWRNSLRKATDEFACECDKLLSGYSLPRYEVAVKGVGEDGYIEAASTAAGYKSVSAHHKKFPDPPLPRLEVCDLCFDGFLLVQVKRGCGYESVNDACSQVMQAATFLSEDPDFLAWAQEQVFDQHGIAEHFSNRRNYMLAVAFVCAAHDQVCKSLTVRAMDSLIAFKEHLEARNFVPVILGIEDATKTKGVTAGT